MKCVLFDEKFEKKAFVSKEYSLITEGCDIVEIDPETYWQTFVFCIKTIGKENDLSNVSTLTFTTQGETLIPVDKDLCALRRAIVWIDARAEEDAEKIKKEISAEEFYRTTGLPVINGALPLAKLMWIKRCEKEIYDKTYKFLLLEDYLIARLTKKTVSEMSLLSSTGWFDINSECYFDELLEKCKIDKSKLPEIYKCASVVANVCDDAAKETGLSESTVVTTGAMDQISSAVGAGNVLPGTVTETTGTALVIGATSDKADYSNPEMLTIYKHFDHSFLYMPFCNTAGIVLKWFKDNFLFDLEKQAKDENKSVYALVDEYAEHSQPGCGGVTLLPHFAGKSVPRAMDNASGVLFGLKLSTTRADVTRSVLEGVGYMLCEVLEALERSGVAISEVRSLGGGSYSALWSQIKADICQKKFYRMNEAESTSLGAAVLGACAIDSKDVVSVSLNVAKTKRSFEPDTKTREVYRAGYEKYLSLYNSLEKEF